MKKSDGFMAKEDKKASRKRFDEIMGVAKNTT